MAANEPEGNNVDPSIHDLSRPLLEWLTEIARRPGIVDALSAPRTRLPALLARASLGKKSYFLLEVPTTPVNLTGQQKSVLKLVIHGLSNREISREQGIQQTTVASHLNRLFRKFNVDSRTALAVQGIWMLLADPAGDTHRSPDVLPGPGSRHPVMETFDPLPDEPDGGDSAPR